MIFKARKRWREVAGGSFGEVERRKWGTEDLILIDRSKRAFSANETT